MREKKKEGTSFSSVFLAVSLAILFLHVDDASVEAVAWKANNGSVTVRDGEWDEVGFSSHFARMLYDVSQSVTGQTSNKGQPSVSSCPRVQNYRSCLPNPNGSGPRQRCGDYTRSC